MNVSSTEMICVVAVCVVGVSVIAVRQTSRNGGMSGFVTEKPGNAEVTGVVETAEKRRSGTMAVTLSLCGATDEKTVVYMRDTSRIGEMLPGDTLVVQARLKRVENFAEGFDYVGYMARKGIYFICFRTGDCSVFHSRSPEFRFRVRRVRDVCIAAMRRWLSPLKKENAELALAFLTGEKERLDEETLENFRGSGMMHTLALSGLHVGIIYSILSFVFLILGNYPASKKIRSVIVILCLWPYGVLTGLGTSICRAVIMATVYELAVILERERSPLNALAVSAVIITLADPSAPGTISFQLSFGAMLGIYIFYRPLSSLVREMEIHPQIRGLEDVMANERLPWHPGIPEGDWLSQRRRRVAGNVGAFLKAIGRTASRLRGKLWNLYSLSLACQMITAPLVWVEFGSFPCWSLLANILCGPLVAVSMMLVPICVALHRVLWLGKWSFFILDRVLDALRFCVGVMG